MKKITIIFLLVFVLTGIAGGVYFKYLKKNNFPSEINVVPTQNQLEELSTWVDQSEFSISYPKTLSLDPHEQDQENYAHLEFTSPLHPGSLIVWCKDVDVWDIKEWVKREKIQGSIDTTLGGFPAKKILSKSDPKKMTISTVREGYLYQIEANLTDSEFWGSVVDVVVPSFEFIAPEKKTEDVVPGNASDNGYGEADIILEEEIVQ